MPFGIVERGFPVIARFAASCVPRHMVQYAMRCVLGFCHLYCYRPLVLCVVLLLAACDIVSVGPPRTPSADSFFPSSAPTDLSVPTEMPAPERLARGLSYRAVGEYDRAAEDFHALTQSYAPGAETRAASFYLAESFVLRRRWTSAVEALRAFVAHGPQDDFYAQALFLLARGQEEAGTWADAVASYQRYRELNTPLVLYARLREAAQQRALGLNERAAEGYEAVASGDVARGERAGSYEKAIALWLQLGQRDRALRLYQALLALAELPDYRARILGEAAELAQQMGALDQAHLWWREIAEHMPATPQALTAVQQLAAAPAAPLDPLLAASVYREHAQWEAAIVSFDAAIAADPGETAHELRRQRALVQRNTGDFAGALAALDTIAVAAPTTDVGLQARLDWAQTKGQSGDTSGAIAAYRAFAETFPDDARAAEALSRVATLLDRLGDAEGAIQQRLALGQRYPASEQAHDALASLGWTYFDAGRLAEARDAWELLSRHADGTIAAQAAFWAAYSAHQTGQDAAARALWDRVVALAPDSYYGARASELLGHAAPGLVPIGTPISTADWRATEDWIASWSSTPAYHVDEHGYPPDIAQTGAVARAIALQNVDLQSESIAEWNEARTRYRDDPQKMYLIARLADEHSVPYIALKAAEDILHRAPASHETPSALRRLLFPTPYSEVVLTQAQTYNLDPRLLYAMLRQESLFNPGATSWVGACGLAQIMPSTAQGIAQQLVVDHFQESDLYRPALSIRFGAFYLSRQITAMEGSFQAGLAAYNGGPGNAQRWAGGTHVADADRFTEAIDYIETRGYVKLVYGYYGAYRQLYQVP